MSSSLKGSLTRFEWDGVVRNLGNIWTLSKTGRTLSCRLCTHPLGWELRLFLDGDFYRTEACRSEKKVFDTADAWRAEAEKKGWVSG